MSWPPPRQPYVSHMYLWCTITRDQTLSSVVEPGLQPEPAVLPGHAGAVGGSWTLQPRLFSSARKLCWAAYSASRYHS